MRTVDIYRVTFLVVIAIIIKYLRFEINNFYSTPAIKKMFFYTFEFESQYTRVNLIFQTLFWVYFDLYISDERICVSKFCYQSTTIHSPYLFPLFYL